ncbi:transposase [Microcoleus sp. MOSTC5]|uniref:transposase n=1 Tax=Microcoleus sp. MOSTC5 TaxID=3055378 RepID=UPI002FCF031E
MLRVESSSQIFLSNARPCLLFLSQARSGSIHRCHEVQHLWSQWESQGLYIFFLPKYCSEMNPIELESQHIKKDELAATFI